MSAQRNRFLTRRLTTKLDWEDVDLPASTRRQVEELQSGLQDAPAISGNPLVQGRGGRGNLALFVGASGTGKTLTATLLGKATGRAVYRVGLAAVVSKYIGETEKNLAAIFERAYDEDWILFFDEADALFGKRSDVKEAHDRYANQEVSYLLQRLEKFNGLAVLASNGGFELDDALKRRCRFVIEFPRPDADRRGRIRELTSTL